MSYTCRAHTVCTGSVASDVPHSWHCFYLVLDNHIYFDHSIPVLSQGGLSVRLFSSGSSFLNFLSFSQTHPLMVRDVFGGSFPRKARLVYCYCCYFSCPCLLTLLPALPVSLTFLPVLLLIQSPLLPPAHTLHGFLLG